MGNEFVVTSAYLNLFAGIALLMVSLLGVDSTW